MSSFNLPALRRFATFAITCAVLATASTLPGSAQMREQMQTKIVTDAANSFVTKIQGESCSAFAATMAQSKSGSSSSTPSKASAMMKSNPAARTQFINIVAAPLVNKMFDCNMMPNN
jgi:predicted lysophospholipase L1 biosynthesis ABC-type transport system permease subunit